MALWWEWWSRSKSRCTMSRIQHYGIFVSGWGLLWELMKGTRKKSRRSLEPVLRRLRCLFAANCRRMLQVRFRWYR